MIQIEHLSVVGRPTKFEHWMCGKIVEVGAVGGTATEMCCAIGIHADTLYEWIKPTSDVFNKEFTDAFKTARALSQAWWEREGRKATMGGVPGFQGATYAFMMKNIFRNEWQDSSRVDSNSTIQMKQETPVMEQLQAQPNLVHLMEQALKNIDAKY